MSKQWYVIHTYSGYEGKAKLNIVERLKSAGLEDKVGEILVPTEDVVEVRGGKRRVSTRKFFPGYILIEMEVDNDTWYLIKNTPKVTGFLGGTTPTPLPSEQVQSILKQMEEEPAGPKPKAQFEPGENIRVVDGPFVNFTGVVDEIFPDRGKLRVMVSIFGRSTPVELEVLQAEKI